MSEQSSDDGLPPEEPPVAEVATPSGRHRSWFALPSGPVQFGLQSMLWFMLVCSAYFAQLGAVWHSEATAPRLISVEGSAIVLAWLVLAVFYLRIRFRQALIVHCSGLAILGILVLFVGADEPGTMTILILVGCFMGSLVSLPVVILMMLVWAVGRERRKGE
jgi:hypothetical protein